MAKLIEVEERNLDYIFGKNKPYKLDVYQRDYRWSDEKDYKMITLFLKDIERRFEHNMKHHRSANDDLKTLYKDVNTEFKAYFVNAIMLNEQGTDIFIVDGQQRLTTTLLLMIKLYHLGIKNEEGNQLVNVDKLLGNKIYEEDMTGEKHFKISNEDRNRIIKKIFNKEVIVETDITNLSQKNLKANYNIISKFLDEYFYDAEGGFRSVWYNAYVYNLLLNIVLIEQVIKDPEDVAFIFETANDRGKELEPHEVLKGMLLGILNAEEKEKYNQIWNKGLETFYQIDGNYKNVDEFFRTYFRAKYADNTNQYNNFSGKYHRTILSNDKLEEDLDTQSPEKIKQFIENDYQYYYKAYLEIAQIAQNNSDVYVASNHANEQGQQTLLILSSLKLKDTEKKEKISLVAKKLDQLYVICRLVGIYDSRDIQRIAHEINRLIRNQPLDKISDIFDDVTIKYFNDNNFNLTILNDVFEYKYFEKARFDGKFTKYILSRIDYFLADLLNEHSFAKQNSFHFIMNSGRRSVNGFHIEHLYAHNDKIRAQFCDENGEFDDKLFHDERNRLGALILLKGNENIRTSNWVYKKKRKSYINSGFLWNKILTGSINQASLNSCSHPIIKEFRAYEPIEDGLLTKDAIDERQKLLFLLIREIYQN